ncbi:MAG: DUF3179 domain-containing protein [Pseudomonadota bacterium]
MRTLSLVSLSLIIFGAVRAEQTLAFDELGGFDVSDLRVERSAIEFGGPSRDTIPALNSPKYVSAEEVQFLSDTDKILGFELGGEYFAYPRHILNWHEIVNDQVDGKAFAIVYCPLCGSGTAFSAPVTNQGPLKFGVSGLLYNSDVLLFDRETNSLWSQLTGSAIAGPMAGTPLHQLPMVVTSWQAWRQEHPQTLVLADDQGFKRNYRHDPYTGYETSELLFFEVLRQAPKQFHTKARVLGVEVNGVAKAYPYSELKKLGVADFLDTVGDSRYRVYWDAHNDTARIEDLDGRLQVTTELFWFAWYNFHPNTEVFTSDSSTRSP